MKELKPAASYFVLFAAALDVAAASDAGHDATPNS